MKPLDPRVTAARIDLAAAELEGVVSARRFVAGRDHTIRCAVADLRHQPDDLARLQTQMLFGEKFTVYDENNGWAWGQAGADNYVGYARMECLLRGWIPASHRVSAIASPWLSRSEVTSASIDILPMNARVHITRSEGRFASVGEGFVFADHLSRIDETIADWVSVAERFSDVPYLWGGITTRGIDCSGLVQAALRAAGIEAPRDTDMMEAALGRSLPIPTKLRRGDLVFWKNHVGIMRDAKQLLHANAYFMAVTSEALKHAAARIAATDGPIKTIKRLG